MNLLFHGALAFGQTNHNNLGTVIFNMKFSSFNEKGIGGKIKIVNVLTEQEFEGKSKIFNPYVIISNLPPGVYKVTELTIKTGSGQIRYYDTLKFNHIEINEAKAFYLGTYRTKKTKEVFKLNYVLTFDSTVDTLKIKDQLLKFNVKEDNIDFKQKLFKSDTTNLKIKI